MKSPNKRGYLARKLQSTNRQLVSKVTISASYVSPTNLKGMDFSATLCVKMDLLTPFFRNDPAPRKYIVKGLSPLHARCMALFDSLVHDFHKIGLDNLFMSAKFSKAAFNHTKKGTNCWCHSERDARHSCLCSAR